MNKNNNDNNTEAVKIANALKPFAKKWFDEWGKSCLRSKKMTVSTAPNGTVIGVKDAFSDTEIFIKYMAECSNAQVGDTVWCKWMYDNMQTLYADSMGDISEKDVTFNNVTVDGVLDVTQRRCYTTLSSAGWYRVFEYDAASSADVQGECTFIIDISVVEWTREVHNITLYGIKQSLKFGNETSVLSAQFFDKIRYIQNGTHGYIDVHYTGSYARRETFFFDVKCSIIDYLSRFKALNPTAVADAPSGETVLTTYEFTTDGIRTITLTPAQSSVTINRQKAVRSGNVVSLWVDFTLSEAISGYGFLINSPTFASDANALVYNASSTLQTNVRLYADAENSGLRCYGAFPAGRYVAFVTYITTDV